MLPELINSLTDPKSSKRRSAAKKLRKLKKLNVCNSLILALNKEVLDRRTWETQYHLVMAIGESDCLNELPDLYRILQMENLAPMVKMALSDAITRIENSTNFLDKAIEQEDNYLIDGALRAACFTQLQIPSQSVDKLIDLVLSPKIALNPFWVAAAAAGSDSTKLEKYLKIWVDSNETDLSRAAKAALDKKYLRWPIL